VRYGPPDFDGGDTILKYLIEWDTAETFNSKTATGEPLGHHVVVGGQRAEYFITGLSTGVRYFVRVLAYNAARGYGDVSLSSPRSEVPRMPPALPTLGSVSVLSGTELEVKFNAAWQRCCG
jgi:hypothetical protein